MYICMCSTTSLSITTTSSSTTSTTAPIFMCLSIYLSTCLSIYLPICLHVTHVGVKYYQWKGSDFNEEICAAFIDLSIQAKKSNEVAALLVQSSHRMGAWMNKTSLKNILEALSAVEDENNVELMVRIISTCVSKGLSFIVTTEALELIFMKIIKLNATDQYDQFVALIEKHQSTFSPAAAVNLHELKAKYPITATPAV